MAEYKIQKKQAPEWGEVDVLAETYEPGKPQGEDMGHWEQKLLNRGEKIKFIQEGLRYWYSKEKRVSAAKKKDPGLRRN